MDSVAHGSGHVEDHDHHEEHTNFGVSNLKLSFWIFLASDCFFFGSLIGTYMAYRGKSLVGPYPQDVFSVEITSISTFLLLMSSLTMVLAVRAAKVHAQSKSTSVLVDGRELVSERKSWSFPTDGAVTLMAGDHANAAQERLCASSHRRTSAPTGRADSVPGLGHGDGAMACFPDAAARAAAARRQRRRLCFLATATIGA